MANLNSVKKIRAIRDKIRKKIKELDLRKYKDQTFGPEGEYTYRGMIGGLDSILTDISTLTQYESRFIKLSTYNDRRSILTHLNNINSYLSNPNNLYQHIDNIKKELRNYNIRNFSENLIEFNKEIDEIRKLKLQVQESLSAIDKNKGRIEDKQRESNGSLDEINKQLETLNQSIEKTTSQYQSLKNSNVELEDIKTQSQKAFSSIQKNVNEAESNKKLIDSFAKNVEERDKKLTEIEQRTEANDNKLQEYEVERTDILKQAEELISATKKALNYGTAEGLSASFHSQYRNAKNEGRLKWWVWGAAISLCLTLGLGIWILATIQDEWFMVLGRILLLPIPIAAATFCAKQYNKQKNIIEDYAYKTTIAKAIVGFSEQLKKNGKDDDNSEYVEYIQKALREIHQDPLRPRKVEKVEVPNNQMEAAFDLAKKMVEFSKITNSPE